MFVRYDQDLTPYFERLQAEKMARQAERQLRREARMARWREGWSNLLAHVRIESRRG